MKKTTAVGIAVGAAIAVGVTGSALLQPIAHNYIAPMVKEKLNQSINGTATYEAMDIGFTGDVTVKNLVIKDQKHNHVLDTPEVTIHINPWGAIKAGLSGNSPIGAIGTITIKNPKVHIIESKKGKWNVSHLVIDRNPDEPFAYRGNLVVHNGNVLVTLSDGKEVHLSRVDGNMDFSQYTKAQASVETLIEGQPLSLKGYYDMKGSDFKAQIKTDGFQLAPFQHLLKDDSQLSICSGSLDNTDVTISRHKDTITLVGGGDIHHVNGAFRQYTIADGSGHIGFEGDKIHLKNIKALINGQSLGLDGIYTFDSGLVTSSDTTIHIGDGLVKGYGWFNTVTKAYEGQIEADKADIAAIGTIMGKDIAGSVTGHVYVKSDGHSSRETLGTIEGAHIQYNGTHIDHLKTAFIGRNDQYSIPYMNARIGDGKVSATGTIDSTTINMFINGTAIPLSLANAIMPTPVTGIGDITSHIEGAIENPTVTFFAAAHNGSVKDISFTHAVAKGQLKEQHLHLEDAIVNTGKGTFHVKGDVQLNGAKNVDLRGTIRNIRVESLLKGQSNIPLTGWLDTDITIGGTLDAPKALGKAHLTEGSFMGQLIEDAKADFTYHKGNLFVPNFTVLAYGSTIHGSGSVMDNHLDFTMKGQGINPRFLIKDNPYHLDGIVNFDGNLKGTTKAPVFNGHIMSKELVVNKATLRNLSGDIYYDPSVVNVKNFSFDQGEGHVNMRGGMRLQNEEIFGLATVTNGEVGNLIKTFDIPIYHLDGKLNGRINVAGTIKQPSIQVAGTIENTSIRNKVMGTTEIDIGLHNKLFTIYKLKMPIGDGVLAAQGSANLQGQADMQIVANNVPIEALVALSGKEIPLEGQLQGVITATGKTVSPKVELSATINDLLYNGVKLDQIYALATIDKGTINLNQIVATRGQYKVKLYGKIPFKAIYAKAEDRNVANYVDLTLDLNESDLGAVQLFAPFIKEGLGETSGKLQITGPLSNVNVDGNISVANGKLTFKDVKEPLDHINGNIHFGGKKANLNVTAKMGQGNLSMNGVATWYANTLHKYQGKLDLDHLDVHSKYFNGQVVGNFELLKGKRIPLLKGYLNLDHTQIDIPLAFETSPSSIDTQLDITVESPDQFRFYNSLLYDLTLQGKVHAGGTLSHPHMEGQVDVKQGTVKYLNNRFKVLEGNAKFIRYNTFLPDLYMKATTDVQDYKVDMSLKGPVEQMKLKLTSTPALSEQQILSLLTVRTLDINSANLQKSALNTLLTTGLETLVFGRVESAAKDQLHLDRFAISNTYLDPFKVKVEGHQQNISPVTNYYTLEIGKYVFPNFMLTLGTGLNYNLSRIGLEYRLNKYFNLTAWQATNQNAFAGMQFKYRF